MSPESYIPWSQSVKENEIFFRTNLGTGLSNEDAHERLKIHGHNILSSKSKPSQWLGLLKQFKSPMVLVLILAFVFSAFMNEWIDAISILAILTLNAALTFFQEHRAGQAIEALKKMSSPKARVLRQREIFIIDCSKLVPGDVVLLESGDLVPADGRIFLANQLFANESALTGESAPVEKQIDSIPPSTLLADRTNMLFAGTSIQNGTVKLVITSTGLNTEIGKIAALVQTHESPPTPLQIQLETVVRWLLLICGLLVLFSATLEFYKGTPLKDILLLSIGLAIAAIPEGLPAVVTLALSLAVIRMAKRNAIIRYLPAVEALGSTDIICTDKTGTLTTGIMTLTEVFLPQHGVQEHLEKNYTSAHVLTFLEKAETCSNVTRSVVLGVTGDSIEVAVTKYMDLHHPERPFQNKKRIFEFAFDSDRKRMSVATDLGEQSLIICKGAPEAILSLVKLTAAESIQIQKAIDALTRKGRRVIAVAERMVPSAEFKIEMMENELAFLGLISVSDPPRYEAKVSVQACKKAGIRVIMITGDHPHTARAIAMELGILSADDDSVLTGHDFSTKTDNEIQKLILATHVFARVTPQHKLYIVEILQKAGFIVAMTGDGVNDAPALKQASIGIAMGRSGTEVARQASSIILADDNFATIVAAVEEGRGVFNNIKRTIQYLLSGNLSELSMVLIASLLGWPLQLAPIHLLWINLVTDGLPALALATEPIRTNYLTTSQRMTARIILNSVFYRELFLVAGLNATLGLTLSFWCSHYISNEKTMTMVFSFLVFSELFRSFASRSSHLTVFQKGFGSNRFHLLSVVGAGLFQILILNTEFLRPFFRTINLEARELLLVLSISLIPFLVLELKKFCNAKRHRVDNH